MSKKKTRAMTNKEATIREMSEEERIEALANSEEAKMYGEEWDW